MFHPIAVVRSKRLVPRNIKRGSMQSLRLTENKKEKRKQVTVAVRVKFKVTLVQVWIMMTVTLCKFIN